MPFFHSRRGFILIIVLALLGVLAFIALEFAQTSRTARQLSQRLVCKTKANLVARSGLEKALVGIRINSWHFNPVPFEQTISSAGDDRNRNGVLDVMSEDPVGDGILDVYRNLEEDPTPSLALAEDGTVAIPKALSISTGGKSHGTTWVDSREDPRLSTSVHILRPCVDVNGGVDAGKATAGVQYAADFGQAYAASDPTHPFNVPLVRLLNAWGNYHKYKKMVRPGKTYDWSLTINNDRNLHGSSGGDTQARFDVFYPSQVCPGETAFGTALVMSRPTGGYVDLRRPLELLESYIKSWADFDGLKGYPSGDWRRLGPDPAIDPVTEADIGRIKAEFMAIASSNPVKSYRWWFKRETPPAKPTGGIQNAFVLRDTRAGLNVKKYALQHLPVNVNTCPPSVLTAIIHGLGKIWIWSYLAAQGDAAIPYTDNILNYAPHNTSFNPNGTVMHLSENCFDSSVFPKTFIADDPLFSLTESLAYAQALASRRQAQPFHDFSDISTFLQATRMGYDHKGAAFQSADCRFDGNTGSSKAQLFTDIYYGYHRQALLSGLLNPHLNSSLLVWDQALPRAFTNAIHGVGYSIGGPYGSRRFNTRFFFDKFDSHEIAATAETHSGSFEIRIRGECLGSGGDILASTALSTSCKIFELLHVHSQRDFEAVCNLGTGWITYPEAPGVPPAAWDGQIALRPNYFSPVPWGSSLKARYPLQPYGGLAPTSNNAPGGSDLWPSGPRAVEGGLGLRSNRLLNSLNPGPGGPIPSLLPNGFANVDLASDLLPGGGIRVSPFHNSFWHPSPIDPAAAPPDSEDNTRRREAILVLRNSLTTQGEDGGFPNAGAFIGSAKVISSFHDGAVSFWFKPLVPIGLPLSAETIAGRTLFHTHFVIEDTETENRCASPLALAGEANYRKWFLAQLRLVWGHFRNHSSGNNLESKTSYHQYPPGAGGAGPGWAFIQGISAAPVASWPGFKQSNYPPIASGAGPYFFSEMKGIPLAGFWGHVPGPSLSLNGITSAMGDYYNHQPDVSTGPANRGVVTGGHWWNVNPVPNEALFLEFQISKFAYLDGSIFNNWAGPNLNPVGGLADWAVWSASDLPSVLARSGSYLNDTGTPLHLMDSRMATHVDFHSVRKLFLLGHPTNPTAAAGTCRAPLDRNGDHQALLGIGRWNHLFIAWRNLWRYLDNTVAGHRGGSLAVYVNGVIKHTSPGGFQIGGMQVQEDYCEAYSGRGNPAMYSPWETGFPPGTPHPLYQNYFVAPSSSQHFYMTKTLMFPRSPTTGVVRSDLSAPRPLPGDLWKSGAVAGASQHSYSRGTYDYLAPDYFMNFPSRFHFGCQPHSLINTNLTPPEPYFFPTGVAWGAFMDIQIFDEPSLVGLPDSPCHADGGFKARLPFFENHSPLPSSATFTAKPLLLLPVQERNCRLISVSWSAHLPEFHNFWDDQDPTPGPGSGDVQALTLRVMANGVDLTLPDGIGKSQDPAFTPALTQWRCTTPVKVDSADDLELSVAFQGPPVVLATPLIEDFSVVILRNNPVFKGFVLD